ncbi:hypothetical protein FE257_011968 [Aspergillus nanangensis]|uniref:BRCT domain-containing protein n=1 Tax=Aspergillus nanangensis TaxID=2582783 RepID=A0AAD4CHZ3_ASPNN|nr:hypothetical protein FE257_011968 [Aspergillus nanangensis]
MPPPTPLNKVTPQNHLRFDPWNSASTGHQRGDNTGSRTNWQKNRSDKLSQQFQPPNNNNPPAGEWTWTSATSPEPGQQDIRTMFRVSKNTTTTSVKTQKLPQPQIKVPGSTTPQNPAEVADTTHTSTSTHSSTTATTPEPPHPPSEPTRQIFHGVNVYLNAPSHSLLSDHKLRHLLVAHGATVSLALSRRVTHVLIGRPNAGPARGGFGGGLAATKLQREIARAGSRAVKVVFVDWVIESVRAGKRLSEMRFAMHVAPKGQRSLVETFFA